jgi:hypothetical protein
MFVPFCLLSAMSLLDVDGRDLGTAKSACRAGGVYPR